MSISDHDRRHRRRMQHKKRVIDAAIAQADRDQGLLLLLTGNGKGKSSSAFGMLARALGHGMHVGVAQFIKGRSDTGEERFFRQHPAVTWCTLGEGFTWNTQDLARDRETAHRAWSVVQGMLQQTAFDLILLDELTYPLKYGWLDSDSVVADLNSRPAQQHVIITGRGAPDALYQLADIVTEMDDVKHAFRAGVRAQPGIDR